MTNEELDTWWCSCSVRQKLHIANKKSKTEITDIKDATALWLTLEMASKQAIHDHCTGAHGMVREDWQEGQSMSY